MAARWLTHPQRPIARSHFGATTVGSIVLGAWVPATGLAPPTGSLGWQRDPCGIPCVAMRHAWRHGWSRGSSRWKHSSILARWTTMKPQHVTYIFGDVVVEALVSHRRRQILGISMPYRL